MTQLSLTAAPALPAVAGPVLWIGLNPSTATETVDDPTIAKEQRFIRSWGVDLVAPQTRYQAVEGRRYTLVRPGMVKANLFSLRSTDPRGLLHRTSSGVVWEAIEGAGAINVLAIRRAATEARTIICAWGGPYGPKALAELVAARAQRIVDALLADGRALHVLALTKDGIPRHPLYLPGALRPVLWRTP